MYSRSAVSLGFSTCGYARYRDKQKISQVHLRDFEAPMSGAFYIVEYQDELSDFYEIGQEIVCYASREELLERSATTSLIPSERERISRAGYEQGPARPHLEASLRPSSLRRYGSAPRRKRRHPDL